MALGELEIKKSTLTMIELHWKIPGFFSFEIDDDSQVGPNFTFLNYNWDVNIKPSDYNSDVYLRLDVDDGVGRSYDMICKVGIIKADGSVARIKTFLRTLCSGHTESVGFSVIRREVLLRCKTELAPLDNLTIMCYMQLLRDPMELRDVDDGVGRSYDMMCKIGIIKADGSVARIKTFLSTLCSGHTESVGFSVIRREVLLRCKTELVPLDKLTIMCYMQLLRDPMELRELNMLSRNIEDLFTNEEFCDITLDVKDKKFKAHKAIIAARSPIFAEMLKDETLEKDTGVITIPDCDPDSFKEFLRYLYSGKMENISFRCAVHVFKIAAKFYVNELIWFCMDYIRQNMKVEDFFEIISLAETHDYERLHDTVQDFFNNNLGEILKNDDWQNLLKTNFDLANKLLIGMSSSVEVVRKKARLEI